MIIAQISDTHIALDVPDADRRIEDFERTIDDINALDPPPDVIIHTGDIVHNGTAEEYARAAAVFARARTPVYVMVGNKDNRHNLRAALSQAEGPVSNANFVAYAIEDFSIRLIALDTLNPDSNKGDFCEDRAANLIEMIDADTTRPIAVFAHHPPFEVPVGPDPFHFQTNDIMLRLRQTLQHSGRVAGVFCGHVHRGTAGCIEDIPVLVMPCVATVLRRGDYPTHLTTCPIYHIHRFDPDGGFSSEARIVF